MSTAPGQFPDKRLDQMREAARSFDRFRFSTIRTRFDGEPWVRKDIAESFFLARQLEYVRPGVIETLYPELKSRLYIPVNNDVPSGAASMTVQEEDRVGTARPGSSYGSDYPMVEVNMTESTNYIRPLTDGYQYTVQEIRGAMMAGVPLPARKAVAARDVLERQSDAIAFIGSNAAGAPLGLKGIATLANTVTYTVPAGSAGSTAPELMTPKEILAVLHGIVNSVVTNSLDIHHPDTLMVPLTLHTIITTVTMGDGNPSTILAQFLKDSPFCKRVLPTHKLETDAVTGSTTPWTTSRRMVAYSMDPNLVELVIPQEFEQFPVQQDGFVYKTPCHMRTGGVVAHKPKSIAFGDFAVPA